MAHLWAPAPPPATEDDGSITAPVGDPLKAAATAADAAAAAAKGGTRRAAGTVAHAADAPAGTPSPSAAAVTAAAARAVPAAPAAPAVGEGAPPAPAAAARAVPAAPAAPAVGEGAPPAPAAVAGAPFDDAASKDIPPAALSAVTGYFTAMPQWTAYEAGEMTVEQLAEGVTRFSRAVLEPVMGSQLEAAGQVRGS